MANRKVLINYHTSGSSAPTAANVFHGELVVAHETGKETIFTKNNANEMVPFISCAQTIAIIDGKIQASDTDVKVATGETHLEVATGGTGHENEFTLNTKDVQSEAEFEAYSAATNQTLTSLLSAMSGLTDIVVTGLSGDTIIVAEKVENGTGSNTYNLTHRTATAVTGFNKLDTDAYGHVTAATAVATADIQALGFKTSAETGEDLATVFSSAKTYTDEEIEELSGLTDAAILAAIQALDSETAVAAGKYITGIAIADGKISGITEADLPTLSVESAGTGNVVSQITVDNHKITYQTVSVATSTDVEKLSAATIALSGVVEEDEAVWAQALNDVKDDIRELSGAVQTNETNIDNLSAATLNLSAVTLTGVSMNSSEVTVTDHVAVLGTVITAETQLSTAVTGNGNVVTNITVSDHTITLDKGIDALQNVTATGDSYVDASVATNSAITVGLKTTPAQDKNGIANATSSGALADAYAVKEYVQDIVTTAVNYKGATSTLPTAATVGDLYIADAQFTAGTETVEIGDFIIYDGTDWDVIEKNDTGAITGDLTANTVTLGNGSHTVKSLANGTAGQVLEIGTGGTPEWTNLPQLSTATTGAGNVVSSIEVSDHLITYAMDVTAATNADLTTLSGMVETISGYTKENFTALSAGTIQLSADTKAAIEALSSNTEAAITAAIEALDSTGHTSDTGHYLTSVTITDGKITAVGEEAVPAATPVSTVNGATGDTATAVLNGIYTGGTDGHQLTLSATNKIFSATTSESADTAAALTGNITTGQVTDLATTIQNTKVNSATTAESADTATNATSADKVANALSISGYATSESSALDTTVTYDGSSAQSLTFGTNTAAGKSMSMTSAGVVDVEIIDCGTY